MEHQGGGGGGDGGGDGVRLAVCGAHMRGFPLNNQLGKHAQLIEKTTTSEAYKLYKLDDKRPALVRTAPQDEDGVKIEIEVYKLENEAVLGQLLLSIPQPLGLGKIELEDGKLVTGFICVHGNIISHDTGVEDISDFKSWRKYKAATDDAWLCQSTAVEVIEMLKTKYVTPERLIQVVERRVADVNPQIHAVVTPCFSRARSKLRELEERMSAMTAFPPGFLYGLPVLIKDTSYVHGVRFSLGFYTQEEDEEHVKKMGLTDSDPLVLQLEQMGGLVVGKTNLSEFAAGGHSFNNVFPCCVNPHDTRMSAGGSSGGAGAALAAKLGWLAQGSDRGGSVRLPAHFNGIVGLRASPGIVMQAKPCNPRYGALHSMNGPMARTVEDCALFLDAMMPSSPDGESARPLPGWENYPASALPAARSTTWLEIARAGMADAGSLNYRVAFSTLKCSFTRAEVVECCVAAATMLAGGANVDVMEEPFDIGRCNAIYSILRADGFLKTYGHMDKEDGTAKLTLAQKSRLKPETKANAALAERLEAFGRSDDDGEFLAVKKAYEDTKHLQDELTALFDKAGGSGYDILCCPVAADVAFPADLRYPCRAEWNDGQGRGGAGAWSIHASIISMTGCPSIVLPVGTLDGLPVGMQLVGKRGDDALLIRAAAALETLLHLEYRRGVNPHCGTIPSVQIGPKTEEETQRMHEQAQTGTDDRLAAYMAQP